VSLIDHLKHAECFDHAVTEFTVVETHISWVLLTGQFAYKLKKPVNFGFLDFSSLEQRRFYCEEELRLNRRLAPALYLEVVSITGSEKHPHINGSGPVLEYAVKMCQFSQALQLDHLLASRGLDSQLMDRLAGKVADFHNSIATAAKDSPFGDLAHITAPVRENFRQIHTALGSTDLDQMLARLQRWNEQQLAELAEVFYLRKQDGFIRECHGDMHLRNITLWQDEIVIFDCIEFNKNLYWIDVMSDIAFLIMDLEDRQQAGLANRFLNGYLEKTGDYAGLALLRFYKVYRALVRAKVDALRTRQEQPGTLEYQQTYADFLQYLHLAERYTQTAAPCLLLNHGFSGAGKSHVSRLLLEKIPLIQIRSDVERKRLFETPADRKVNHGIGQDIYTPEATQRVYARLVELARQLLLAGFAVIVDAANLQQQQRNLFFELTRSLQIPCFILDYQAVPDLLRQRVTQRLRRAQDVSDATLEVLEHQLQTAESLSDEERPFVIKVDTSGDIDIEDIISRLQVYNIRF